MYRSEFDSKGNVKRASQCLASASYVPCAKVKKYVILNWNFGNGSEYV